jgi:hypothetical protein
MRSPCYLCAPPSTIETLNHSLLNFVSMTPKPISTVYLINSFHQYVYPLIVARQRLAKNVTPATNTYSIVGRVVSCAVRVVSKESLWSCLCIP